MNPARPLPSERVKRHSFFWIACTLGNEATPPCPAGPGDKGDPDCLLLMAVLPGALLTSSSCSLHAVLRQRDRNRGLSPLPSPGTVAGHLSSLPASESHPGNSGRAPVLGDQVV